MKKIMVLVVIIALFANTTQAQYAVRRIVNNAPTLYTVMGGGTYCAGLPGIPVNLSGSEVGVEYQLYCSSDTTGEKIPMGKPIQGTGSVLYFGLQVVPGICTITGRNISSGCISQMSGWVAIQVVSAPSVKITASGPTMFCGQGSVTLTAEGCGDPDCTFQWQQNGMYIPGANMKNYVASVSGAYTVLAINEAGCMGDAYTMVVVLPLPQVFMMTSSATTFIEGSTGVSITLNTSQVGINYQLMLNGIQIGYPIIGTGGPIVWPDNAAEGVYTITATETVNGCSNQMKGSVKVTMQKNN